MYVSTYSTWNKRLNLLQGLSQRYFIYQPSQKHNEYHDKFIVLLQGFLLQYCTIYNIDVLLNPDALRRELFIAAG